MKDRKVLVLLFLLAIWLFFLIKGPETQPARGTPSQGGGGRRRVQREKLVLELDYEKYRRRREVELSEEGNLFEAVLRREEIVNKAKEIKVTEQDLIMKELKAISFLGVVSSSSHKKIYLEYRGEICEVVDGKSMDISTKNGKHSVVVSLEEEDLLTIYEPVELLKVNINI